MNKDMIYEKIQRHNELAGTNTDELFKFLSVYKEKDILYTSCLRRKLPHATSAIVNELLDILIEEGFVSRVPAYSCPICGHTHVYMTQEEFEHLKELDEFCCDYCGDETPYNEKYLHFEYRVLTTIEEGSKA